MDTQKELNNIWIIAAKEIRDNLKSLLIILVGIVYIGFALIATGITVAIYYLIYKSMAAGDTLTQISLFNPSQVLSWYSLVAFILVMPAVLIASVSMSSEKKDRTIYQLLSKPVDRSSVILGKYLGSLITISTFLVLSAAIAYILTAILTGVYPSASDLPGVLEALASMVIILLVYVGIGVLISVLTRSPLISIIGSFVAWAALFFSSLIGKAVAYATNSFVPDGYPIYSKVLICLDPTSHGLIDQLVAGATPPAGIPLWMSIIVLCAYAAVLLAVSIAIFQWQDI